MISACAKILPTTAINEGERICTVIDSLSAKVAEQAEEIERLKQALPGFYEAGDITMNKAGCDWVDDLMQKARDAKKRANECEAQWAAWQQKEAEAIIRAETAEAKCKELEAVYATCEKGRHALFVRLNRMESERDTLRRLLTETALPALELVVRHVAAGHPVQNPVEYALSTIRAKLDGVKDACGKCEMKKPDDSTCEFCP